jgi:hypothetical protein
MAELTPQELAELKASKARLLKAMRSGARDVQHDGKRVSYRSIEEMQIALDGINAELDEAETGKRRKRVIYVGAGRGY